MMKDSGDGLFNSVQGAQRPMLGDQATPQPDGGLFNNSMPQQPNFGGGKGGMPQPPQWGNPMPQQPAFAPKQPPPPEWGNPMPQGPGLGQQPKSWQPPQWVNPMPQAPQVWKQQGPGMGWGWDHPQSMMPDNNPGLFGGPQGYKQPPIRKDLLFNGGQPAPEQGNSLYSPPAPEGSQPQVQNPWMQHYLSTYRG